MYSNKHRRQYNRIKNDFVWIANAYIFAIHLGGLAQLARALAWHARGRRFDPDTLHKKDSLR